MEDMIKIPRKKYEELRMQANIDIDLMKQLIESFKDIRGGRIRRVK